MNALPFVTTYDRALAEGFSKEELDAIARFLDTVINRFETLPENYFKTKAGLL